MSEGHHIEPQDPRITSALRALLAAPEDAAYWSALESTIMARLTADDDWTVQLSRWTGLGLVAAAVAALIAGVALVRANEMETREMATLLETPVSFSAQVAAQVGGPNGREATVRYVIEP